MRKVRMSQTRLYDDEENLAHLQFGDEFFATKIQSLSNDEIFCLLDQQKGKAMTEAFEMTSTYINRLVTTKIPDDAKLLAVEIRRQLESLQLRKRGVIGESSKTPLHHYEISSLANLIRDEEYAIEEVLSWIPSLSRFEDDDVLAAVSIVTDSKERSGEGI